jgi:hypothetical protein
MFADLRLWKCKAHAKPESSGGGPFLPVCLDPEPQKRKFRARRPEGLPEGFSTSNSRGNRSYRVDTVFYASDLLFFPNSSRPSIWTTFS